MKALQRLIFITILVTLTSACSLLEIKLERGIEPLPQEQINMRVFSRDFSSAFYSKVEQAADKIAAEAQTGNQGIVLKSNTLMWKINAEQALQRSIFQASPVAAMLDTWVLTAQMSAFYENGAGKSIYAEHQPLVVETSNDLQTQFEKTVQGFLKPADFKKNKEFVQQYTAANPITDMTFSRQSAFHDWLIFREINEFEAVQTFGSVPEVMSDFSDRMAMISEQMPKILGWKAELYALHSNINAQEIQKTLLSISDTSAKFQQLMAQSPEMMQALAADMRQEMSPLLQQLSDSADDKLEVLTAERQALELLVKNERMALEDMIARERGALEVMISKERTAAAVNLQQISTQTVEVVFQELTKTLKSLILYFVLFLLVVFFAPLGLGVWLGRRMEIKKNNKAV